MKRKYLMFYGKCTCIMNKKSIRVFCGFHINEANRIQVIMGCKSWAKTENGLRDELF